MAAHSIILKHCDPAGGRGASMRDLNALAKARRMSPSQVVGEIKLSGLTGRGGPGFRTGVKWETALNAPGDRRYLVCNADEGEVGAFKDRYILSNDPYTLIEGMAIAGYAIKAERAFIYLREEYRSLAKPLMEAVARVKDAGLLEGMDIGIFEGAGAYVCGEESALINSIEGFRGEPRRKPPFPATKGLFRMPTVVNNVETLMNVPAIIENGAAWYASIGTEKSKGTKVFSVCGDVARPGVYEVTMGTPLRELVEDLAGAADIKAVQVGGASGSIIPYKEIDVPLCHEGVLGSGAVLVLNGTRSIVDLVYSDMKFLNEESCGRCTPCREGTSVMKEMLGRLAAGEGTEADIDAIEDLARAMELTSLCGLGQSAPTPVLDSMKHFRDEYDDRVSLGRLIRGIRPSNSRTFSQRGGR